MTTTTQLMRPVSLELGRKSLILVFEGVDLNKAAEWTAFDCFWTTSRRNAAGFCMDRWEVTCYTVVFNF